MHKAYQLEISPAAKLDLKKLPNQVQKKIVFEHFPNIQKEPYFSNEPLIGTLRRKTLPFWQKARIPDNLLS